MKHMNRIVLIGIEDRVDVVVVWLENWPLNVHVALASRHEDSRPIPCRWTNVKDDDEHDEQDDVTVDAVNVYKGDDDARDWLSGRRRLQSERRGGGANDDEFIRRQTTGIMTNNTHPVLTANGSPIDASFLVAKLAINHFSVVVVFQLKILVILLFFFVCVLFQDLCLNAILIRDCPLWSISVTGKSKQKCECSGA